MATPYLYIGDELAKYGFGDGHPFGPDRLQAFWQHAKKLGLKQQVKQCLPVKANINDIERFHTKNYIQRVKQQSESGQGFLDTGDTPAMMGIFDAASYVVGSVLDAIDHIMAQHCQRAFIPIAGLHHARRDLASGFCVFNDCGVAIEYLRSQYQIQRIAYIDIDAHHGDGVFYAFENDPDLIFADLHEDGRFLYPGTGHAHETGSGIAKGTKLNIPMPPYANDEHFMDVWPEVEQFLNQAEPEFILFQCGADSIHGDPITHMQYTAKSHQYATQQLIHIANKYASGRILAMGGGGYNRENLAHAWSAVVQVMIET